VRETMAELQRADVREDALRSELFAAHERQTV
jgi:hypothetical protein